MTKMQVSQEVAARSVGAWDWEPARLNVPLVSCGRFTLNSLARPEGNGHRRATRKVPIKGRRDWLGLARTA